MAGFEQASREDALRELFELHYLDEDELQTELARPHEAEPAGRVVIPVGASPRPGPA
jgi:hypothetical protein